MNPELVQQFFQPTQVNVTVEKQSVISKVRKELVVVPYKIPVGMVVAVTLNNTDE